MFYTEILVTLKQFTFPRGTELVNSLNYLTDTVQYELDKKIFTCQTSLKQNSIMLSQYWI